MPPKTTKELEVFRELQPVYKAVIDAGYEVGSSFIERINGKRIVYAASKAFDRNFRPMFCACVKDGELTTYCSDDSAA